MSALQRISDAIDTWLYELNEKNHWFFRLLEACNDVYAAVVFRGVRRRAASFGGTIEGREQTFTMRFLEPEDAEALLELFGRFDFRYVPPHPLDREAVELLLKRPSYLPFGVYLGDEMVAYFLIRVLAPRRALTGVWSPTDPSNAGAARAAVRRGGDFTAAEGIIDFCTIPLDNHASVKAALYGGFEHFGANRRFQLMRRPMPARLFPLARGWRGEPAQARGTGRP